VRGKGIVGGQTQAIPPGVLGRGRVSRKTQTSEGVNIFKNRYSKENEEGRSYIIR